ncbi:hypothetical protein ACPOL_3176 [Acidisarcina polymorpha]|uniref:Uncharacterized protein n=1 Tax=Acidisarcina polymorpha TaxID=2211140 RepID=A0A2Z5FZZ7_9BACT|nr:hypothetical protein [Acidisarcina polymorpha]AXC12471.1 hypothetical protein ACPOL_3176 [Acidisarcina polymorpha]
MLVLDTAAELKEMFEKQNLRKVAIIDDAYIKVPTRAAFERDNRMAVLLEDIQKWQNPLEGFVDLPRALETEESITDALLKDLYSHKAESAALAGGGQELRWHPFGLIRRNARQASEVNRIELHGPDIEEVIIEVGSDLADDLRFSDAAWPPDM